MTRTREDFDLFCHEVSYWMTRLGLDRYEIRANFDDDGHGIDAHVLVDPVAMTAEFGLSREYNGMSNEHDIRISAFHEVIHVLLHDLSTPAHVSAPDWQVISAEHAIIHALQPLLVEPRLIHE